MMVLIRAQEPVRRFLSVVGRAPSLTKVTAYALADSTRLSRATDRSDVPVDHRSLTKEWLTAVLCRDDTQASVTSFSVTPLPTGTSTRWTMTVGYDRDPAELGLPTRLFAKTTRQLRQRVLMGITETLAAEAMFFGALRKDLEIEAPRGYHGAWHDGSWRSIVLTEDVVATKGARFLDAADTVTRSQAADLLSNLAAMHAAMWEDPRLRQLATLPDIGRVFTAYTDVHARYKAGTERAREVIPDRLVGRHEDLHRGLESVWARADTGPQTLLHGDTHVGNTYITATGAMGYADWQLVRRGSWAFDVAMAMVTSLTVENRREWERDLLEGYLDRLATAGGPHIERAAAFDLYREHVIYPYLAWLCTIGRSRVQPRMQPDDLCKLVIERGAAAVCDLQ